MGGVRWLLLRSNVVRTFTAVLVFASGMALVAPPCTAQRKPDFSKSLAPYVPSPPLVVEMMLDAAGLKPGETLYDLGCGDGRVLITAAQKFRAKAVGVEISETLAKAARENIQRAGLESRAQVILGDATTANVEQADVVTLYLLTHSNELLRPSLEAQLRPGARVVSHDFEIRGWKPTRVETCHVHSRTHRIYVYEMPPKKP
jgi:SAM-dependent methyltransferase